jgi:hypothetical protein
MPVAQLLRHVATLVVGLDRQIGIDQLEEAADACGHLVAARRQLFAAMNTRQHIERVAQLAQGREQACLVQVGDRDALASLQASLQACVSDALGHWRRVGQRFTRATRLLPTQLDHASRLPAAITAAGHQALVAGFVRTGVMDVSTERFEAALGAYMGAHRRCQARVGPALAARERRRRVELDSRTGQATLNALAMAMFEEFLARQSLLCAEGERAGAHHVLHVLADVPALLGKDPGRS